ncbi:hypothetical protein O9993_02335 [Vibrio lentus]|nr:hypothetical protein [Vibrio lentus]
MTAKIHAMRRERFFGWSHCVVSRWPMRVIILLRGREVVSRVSASNYHCTAFTSSSAKCCLFVVRTKIWCHFKPTNPGLTPAIDSAFTFETEIGRVLATKMKRNSTYDMCVNMLEAAKKPVVLNKGSIMDNALEFFLDRERPREPPVSWKLLKCQTKRILELA